MVLAAGALLAAMEEEEEEEEEKASKESMCSSEFAAVDDESDNTGGTKAVENPLWLELSSADWHRSSTEVAEVMLVFAVGCGGCGSERVLLLFIPLPSRSAVVRAP